MSTSGARARPTAIYIAAAVITDREGRLLLVRKSGTTSFIQPGGKVELGESPSVALRRELSEELSIEVDADALRSVGRFTAPAANEPGCIVVADIYAVDIGLQQPAVHAEIEELQWVQATDAAHLDIAPLARDNFLPNN